MANGLAFTSVYLRITDTLALYRLRSVTLAIRGVRRWFRQAAFARTLALLALILGTAFVIERLTSGNWGWPSWTAFGLTLVVLLAAGLVGAATIAQRRIVIESFADQVHPADKADPAAAGLPALVRQELNRLRQLYDPPSRRVGVEVQGLGVDTVGSQSSILLDVSGGDVSDTLRTAVTADSKVTVGFLSVPVAPALALLERVLQGPRLAGSLHRDGTALVLTAELRRRGDQRTWLLREQAPVPGQAMDAAAESHAIGELARRLAGLVTAARAARADARAEGDRALPRRPAALRRRPAPPARRPRRPASGPGALPRRRSQRPDVRLGQLQPRPRVPPARPRYPGPTATSPAPSSASTGPSRPIRCDGSSATPRCVVARDQLDAREGTQHGEAAYKLARNALAKAKSAYQLGLLDGSGRGSATPEILRMRRKAASLGPAGAARHRPSRRRRRRCLRHCRQHPPQPRRRLRLPGARHDPQGEARMDEVVPAGAALAGRLRPDDPNLPFELAKVEDALGSPTDMLEAARQTTALDQDHLRAWLYTAMAASRMGDAVELRPQPPAILWSPCRALAAGPNGVPPLRELTDSWRAQWWPSLPPPNIPLLYIEEVMARWA